MTFPVPPSPSGPGGRRRAAVNYADLGYGPEDLPVPPIPAPPIPVAPVPVAARVVSEPAVVFPAAESVADPALIGSHPVAVTPAAAEEEQWWADEGTELPEDDATAVAAAASVKKPRRRRAAASRVSSDPVGSTAAGRGQGSGIRLVRRLLGLNRPTSAAPAPTAGAGGSSDGSSAADGSAPGWLSDLESGEVLAAADSTADGKDASAGGEPARSPRRVPPPSHDLEVSRAPRELGATVRRALIGLVLLLIAFAGVKQVIWNPIFGRATGTAAAGPAGMDQIAADSAATRYALDYLSYSPAAAGAAAAAVTADVAGGDAAPAKWAGSGYLHADTAVPGGWHVLDAAHAVVSVTVRVHLAMPPSTQATATTTAPTTPAAAAAPRSPSSAAAPPTPTKRTPTSVPTATKPGTAAKRPGKTTAAPKPTVAAVVAPAAAYLSASSAAIPAPTPAPAPAPAPETAAEVGTAAVPAGSASDPGAVPAGWTDLASRWLTLAVPVQSSAGGVRVSPSGGVLSGEAPNLVTADPAWLADPATTTATQPVVTSFFSAYAQSNAGYLAQPGVDLAGLAGTVTPVSVTGWNVSVPSPASGTASASSGVGSAVVTWQLAGTDLQIQQSYSIALTSSQSRWYIAALSPVLSTTA